MTSPFAESCRPSAVLFRATGPDGDVVTLRVPGAHDPPGCDIEPSAQEAFEASGGAFSEQLPMWWVDYAHCNQSFGCGCGPTDLAVAIFLLDRRDREAALRAHLDQARQLREHLEALFDLGSGEVGAVCVACLLDPDEHLADLDNVLDHFARDLIETVHATGSWLEPGDAFDPGETVEPGDGEAA